MDGKILAPLKILVPGEILASMEMLAEQEKQASRWRAPYCLGSAESPTADLSLVPLMSTFSSSMMYVLNLEHVVSKWRVSSRHSAFTGGLSPVPYQLFVTARHAQKWFKSTRQPKIRRPHEIPLISVKSQQSLTLLAGVLSMNRKNVHTHCCCPISSIILTTSELEAIL